MSSLSLTDFVNIPKYCLSSSEKELQNIILYDGYSAITRFSELVSFMFATCIVKSTVVGFRFSAFNLLIHFRRT